MSWSPLVPSSMRALQLDSCRKEGPAKLRPPRHSRRFAKWALQCCLFVMCTIACLFVTLVQQRVVLGKSSVVALRLSSPYRSRLFGLGTAQSTLLPPVVAAGNRSRSGGWHIVHEAVHLATCSPLLCVIWSHPCALDCCCPLNVPHTSGKRKFLALKIRGHIETMCWGPASNARIPALGLQRCVPLGSQR